MQKLKDVGMVLYIGVVGMYFIFCVVTRMIINVCKEPT